MEYYERGISPYELRQVPICITGQSNGYGDDLNRYSCSLAPHRHICCSGVAASRAGFGDDNPGVIRDANSAVCRGTRCGTTIVGKGSCKRCRP